ncbi:hypothetical protein F4823DRAFT_393063 [Ustulina deusta]|nr:hypothetical protein F4823DRAFT_393063 [Ustulina deusta]
MGFLGSYFVEYRYSRAGSAPLHARRWLASVQVPLHSAPSGHPEGTRATATSVHHPAAPSSPFISIHVYCRYLLPIFHADSRIAKTDQKKQRWTLLPSPFPIFYRAFSSLVPSLPFTLPTTCFSVSCSLSSSSSVLLLLLLLLLLLSRSASHPLTYSSICCILVGFFQQYTPCSRPKHVGSQAALVASSALQFPRSQFPTFPMTSSVPPHFPH